MNQYETFIHNEQVRLRASYGNNLAVLSLVSGLIVPVLVGANVTNLMLVGFLALLLSLGLHFWAVTSLNNLKA